MTNERSTKASVLRARWQVQGGSALLPQKFSDSVALQGDFGAKKLPVPWCTGQQIIAEYPLGRTNNRPLQCLITGTSICGTPGHEGYWLLEIAHRLGQIERLAKMGTSRLQFISSPCLEGLLHNRH